MTDDRTNVAIACQGGGSHTAFTAGVLEHLLANWPERYRIVQINDQSMATEPRRLDAIADRRNELSGNISLNQELAFVEQVTEWVEAGMLPADRFTTPEIHRLVLDGRYSSATKLDRDPAFISELIERGRERAAAFLDSKE